MSVAVLKTMGLSKTFGSQVALSDFSLELPKGEVLAVIGPNGSGKSTLLRILLGLSKASSGSFEILGSSNPELVQRRIGVVMDRSCFYHRVSARANLTISAKTKGVGKDRVEELLKLMGLDQTGVKRFQDFSFGMRQRLEIADAMLLDPELNIFDEPTNGLNPQGIIFVRDLIRRLKAEGKTVIISSHYMDELEKVSTRVVLLNNGKIILEDKTENILKDFPSLETAFSQSLH